MAKSFSTLALTQNPAENHAYSKHKTLGNQQCMTKENNSNEEHIFTSNLEENTQFSCMHSNQFIHLPWVQLGPKSLPTLFHTASLQIYTKNPMKNTTQLHKILKTKELSKRKPCMHKRTILRDQTNPMVQGGRHCLPLDGPNKKKSLEKKVSPAEIPQNTILDKLRR